MINVHTKVFYYSYNLFFLKNGPSRPLFHLFLYFQTNITIFTTKIYVKNFHPVYGAGIPTHDLQDHESPPITTRPGLRPQFIQKLPKYFTTLVPFYRWNSVSKTAVATLCRKMGHFFQHLVAHVSLCIDRIVSIICAKFNTHLYTLTSGSFLFFVSFCSRQSQGADKRDP